MTEEQQTILHEKTLEQKVEETVDELIRQEKIRPEEKGVTMQALLKANQGYLGGGQQDAAQPSDEEE